MYNQLINISYCFQPEYFKKTRVILNRFHFSFFSMFGVCFELVAFVILSKFYLIVKFWHFGPLFDKQCHCCTVIESIVGSFNNVVYFRFMNKC